MKDGDLSMTNGIRATILAATVGALAVAGQAFAADAPVIMKAPPAPPPPPIWDIAFGGSLATDYNFRGISQSDRHASASAYVEARWNASPTLQFYAGIAGSSISWPISSALSDPAAEIDFMVGVRPTVDKWSFDFGAIYYYYPGETPIAGTVPLFTDSEFLELYGKVTYAVTDQIALGGNIYWSPDYLNYGIDSTYISGTVKLTAPSNLLPKDVGAYFSGEYGHMSLGATSRQGVPIPSYNYWNAGIGWTWKAFTLDLRYHDTDLSQVQCLAVWNGATPGSSTQKTCGSAWIAKLAFDTTVAALK
jgi:uncharacterized protein (TIGR02001 family)